MAPHSSTPAQKIPWTESGRLHSLGSLGLGHDWATSLSLLCIGERNGNPLQCSCLENPRDRGAWWAAISGVAQGQTRLKRLSSSNSSNRRLCPDDSTETSYTIPTPPAFPPRHIWPPMTCLCVSVTCVPCCSTQDNDTLFWGSVTRALSSALRTDT